MNMKNDSLLINAVIDGDHETVKKLLGASHHPDVFDDVSKTPLIYACEQENFTLIKMLLEHGADIDFQNTVTDNQHTALGYVAESASSELIAFLLEQGADPHCKGWMGLSALDKAEQRQDKARDEVLNLLKRYARPLN